MKSIAGIVVFFIVAALAGCHHHHDDPKPVAEIDKLPPATQNGNNTFGCLINGKAWYTTSSIRASAVYQQGNLTITASLKKPEQNIVITLENDKENNVGLGEETYSLMAPSPFLPAVSVQYSETCLYGPLFTGSTGMIDGQLTFTRFDTQHYIMSGTFEFTIATEGCDVLHVTDGRFDIQYVP